MGVTRRRLLNRKGNEEEEEDGLGVLEDRCNERDDAERERDAASVLSESGSESARLRLSSSVLMDEELSLFGYPLPFPFLFFLPVC